MRRLGCVPLLLGLLLPVAARPDSGLTSPSDTEVSVPVDSKPADSREDLALLGRCVERLRELDGRYRSRLPDLLFYRDRRLFQLSGRVPLTEANFALLTSQASGEGMLWMSAVIGNAIESCESQRQRLEAHAGALWRFLLSLTGLSIVWLIGLVGVGMYGRRAPEAAAAPQDQSITRQEK